jgi:2-octaprenyl-6-methoxyphenol hydroxylase
MADEASRAAARSLSPETGKEPIDISVAGGGPVGMLLALALAGSSHGIRLLDAAEAAVDRPIALTYGSRLLLDRIGAFAGLASTPIETIHVSQQGGFGRTLFRAAEYGLPALGYVVSYTELRAALERHLPRPPTIARLSGWSPEPEGLALHLEPPRGAVGSMNDLHTRVLILADGGRSASSAVRTSPTRTAADASPQSDDKRRDYGQSAVVAQVRAEIAHGNVAWERFTPDGPLALLPHRDGYALIWSTRPESARSLCQLSENQFLSRLEHAFGARLGRFLSVAVRASFPLALRYASPTGQSRVIAIGNAAQTLHPVAGQGLNLGMRDAWELAELLAAAPREALGTATLAHAYARRRRLDRGVAIGLTDALVRIFSNNSVLLDLARGTGLAALDTLPFARRILARRMMFGVRAMP